MEPSQSHPGPLETGTTTPPVEASSEIRDSPSAVHDIEQTPNPVSTNSDAIAEPAPAYTPNTDISGNQPTETKITESQPKGTAPMEAKPTAPVATVTPITLLGEVPAWVDCPFCERRALTRVTMEDSSTTMLASLLCCLICICLVCVPSATKMCHDTSHFCTNCGNKVAHKPHNGQTYPVQPAAKQMVASKHPLAENQTSQGQPAQAQQPQPQHPTGKATQ